MTTQENIHCDSNETFDGIKEKEGQKPPAYFTILFYGLIVWGIVFMAYYLLSGWSSHSEFQDKMTVHQQQATQGMNNNK